MIGLLLQETGELRELLDPYAFYQALLDLSRLLFYPINAK
jgi:hypothetical protein